jgi:protoporphyrinogen/coproporphyrinogen III oxidase
VTETSSGEADLPLVAVVGGGVTGLAAARELLQAPGRRRVVVLEQGARLGGLLHGVPLGGSAEPFLDVGAEAFLARRPEGLDLVADLGLGGDLVHPATSRAAVLARGRLHPMPAGTVMGVPGRGSLTGAAAVLGEDGAARAAAERVDGPVSGDDVAVGPFVAGRLGRAVVDRLVEPLLGGVYAGSAERLSLRATVPALWPAARDGVPLLDAVAEVAAAAGGGPVFGGVRGGLGRLARVLTERIAADGAEVRTGTVVHALERGGSGQPGDEARGWRLRLGPAWGDEVLDADAVVLALPGARAARLLRGPVPSAAALESLETASVAVVSGVAPAGTLDGLLPGGDLSGVLVPPVEGRLVKAMTFSSRKWDWVREAAGGRDVLRLSVGRAREEGDLQRPDEALAAAAVADAEGALGRPLPLADVRVTRWGGALPQYDVGHLARVAAVRTALAAVGRVAVAGAAYDGVGVPACLASARAAARAVLADLAPAGTGGAATMRP